jgi:hypothetical protein
MSSEKAYRLLRFESLAGAMEEAERLASCKVTTSGSFSLGQILEHLGRALDMSSGVLPAPPLPLWLKIAAPVAMTLFKKKLIYGRAKRGFKLPSKAQEFFWPKEDLPTQVALKNLQQAYARFVEVKKFERHPIAGNITMDEQHQLQCRHFELHLGYVHPE